MKKNIFFIGSFIGIGIFSLFFHTEGYAKNCSDYSPSDTIFENFAVPWNVFRENETLLDTDCSGNSITIEAGNGSENTYIWKKAYITKDAKTWEEIDLNGNETKNNQWFSGSADATIKFTTEQIQLGNYIASYQCLWEAEKWNCGCRDVENCSANGLWSIQKFTGDGETQEIEEEENNNDEGENEEEDNTGNIGEGDTPIEGVGEIIIHPDNHYLMYENGAPFFFLGDTQWRLSHHGTREEIDQILDNRKEKGFNAIQIPAMFIGVAMFDGECGWQPDCRTNVYGEKIGEPGNWNEKYWEHMDYTVDAIVDRGMHPILFPAWGPIAGGQLNIFDSEQEAFDYGVWFGNRYKDKKGIMYTVGGDRSPNDIVVNIARGIKSVDPEHLVSFHPNGGKSSSPAYHNSDWLDYNSVQTGHGICDDPSEFNHDNELIGHDWNLAPVKPVLNIEPRYELYGGWDGICGNGNGHDADDVRTSAYWSVFSGSYGISYGTHGVWSWGTDWGNGSFNTGQVFDLLDSEGSFQLQHLKNLMLSRPYFSRIPDNNIVGNQNMVNGIYGDGYIMVYSGQGEEFTVDTSTLTGNITGWWFNPRDGATEEINTDSQTFTPPSNGKGNDWVLVLDEVEKNFEAPGK